ncbi:AurF N-oxygenase family protein [Janibacter sp. GS2]|uniref:AurF N-oxygenase family protein n=1 Tax=Janibacter sp. GS2 TaxID=3442646 RepID=UPI003EC028DF
MTTTAHAPSAPRAVEDETAFQDSLLALSRASVDKNFDAFVDIDWDAHGVDPDDPRFILPSSDVIGGHPWYRSLDSGQQARVGLYRLANLMKVGLQFEQILINGLMNYSFALPNRDHAFRYSTHEATEECHHTQMFQEFVNRSKMPVAGGSTVFRGVSMILPLFARLLPFGFFVGVLAGEEPIDHLQKSFLRGDAELHPLVQRIMQIHVAEEARHIGFAHQYLRNASPQLSRFERGYLSVLTPLIMRWLCDEIMRPSKKARSDMGIPDDVFDEIFWESPTSQKFLRDLFADVRALCEQAGLMNRTSRRVWRSLGIDGRPSRFRSEPASAAA